MNTYTIGQCAVLVGKPSEPLPVPTIRNWTRQYAKYLSADANPTPGVERRYDAKDIAVLRRIHELRSDRLTAPDIMAVLDESPPVAVEVMPTIEPSAAQDANLATVDTPGTAITLAPVLNDLASRLARLEERTAAQPDAQRRQWVLVAVIAGALVVGVILGAVIVVMVR